MGMIIDSTMAFFKAMFAGCVVHIGYTATCVLFALPVVIIVGFIGYKLFKWIKGRKTVTPTEAG